MTPARFQSLKSEAWRLKKAEGIKHHVALRRIAAREGFKSWEALAASVEREIDLSAVEMRILAYPSLQQVPKGSLTGRIQSDPNWQWLQVDSTVTGAQGLTIVPVSVLFHDEVKGNP